MAVDSGSNLIDHDDMQAIPKDQLRSLWSKFPLGTKIPLSLGNTTVDAEIINQNPSVVIIQRFVSPEESMALRVVAKGRFDRSRVVSANGETLVTPDRTSSSFTLEERDHPIVAQLERRIASISGYPLSHCELLQISMYNGGEKFAYHLDTFRQDGSNQLQLQDGGQRVQTLLIYLNSLEAHEGGETHFPLLGIKISPTDGVAVLWSNLTHDGIIEEKALHAGCAPRGATKFVLTCWVRESPLSYRK